MPYLGTREQLMVNPTQSDDWDNLMARLKKEKDERRKDESRMKKKAERIRAKKLGVNLDGIKEEDEDSEKEKKK